MLERPHGEPETPLTSSELPREPLALYVILVQVRGMWMKEPPGDFRPQYLSHPLPFRSSQLDSQASCNRDKLFPLCAD